MVNLLLAALGAACLVTFAVTWHPAAWLLAGVVLLVLAQTRRINQQRGGRKR